MGLDPDSEDSDGDGFSDSDELSADTDPLNPFSWTFGGSEWPDFSDEADAAGVSGDSYGKGEVFPNFTTTDQFGGEVSLYQFYGYVILVDFSAGWCSPCRDSASQAEDIWEEYREDGFIILHAMIESNSSASVNQTFLESWVEDYDIEFPVVDADSSTEPYGAYSGLYSAGLNDGYIPYMILLDQNMELVETYSGSGLESRIKSKVENLLDL